MLAWCRGLMSRWGERVPGTVRLTIAKSAEWMALGSLPILTAVNATTPATNPSTALQMLHHDIVAQYVPLVAAMSILGVAGKAGQLFVGVENKRRVKAVLDALEEACFQDVPEGERYHNRITLFKANKRGTELKPYCRSGERYSRGITSFRIDDNDESRNEGIAGQAWFRRATVKAELPEPPNPWSDGDPACQDYARRGLLDARKAGSLHVRSCSILATPVRGFQSSQWGVLVLDSRVPESMTSPRETLARAFATAWACVTTSPARSASAPSSSVTRRWVRPSPATSRPTRSRSA